MKVQVDKRNYNFEKYVLEDRWLSYYKQIRETVSGINRKNGGVFSVLIIGAGDAIVPIVVKSILEKEHENLEIKVDTFDFASDLEPTYVGDVRYLKDYVKKRYDRVVCCQVLEHLEWDFFESVLQQISEICKDRFVLSLPLYRYPFAIEIETPWFKKGLRFIIERFWVSQIPWNGQHYWEVGIIKKRRKDILMILQKYFKVCSSKVAYGNSYHWFVVCEKK